MSYEHVRRPSKGNFKQELFHRSPPLSRAISIIFSVNSKRLIIFCHFLEETQILEPICSKSKSLDK